MDRGVALPKLPGKAKAPSSPHTRLREGQVQQREDEIDDGAQAISFESYAAHFAMSPEAQAIVDRRGREDLERNAMRQREIEAKKAAAEMQRREKKRKSRRS